MSETMKFFSPKWCMHQRLCKSSHGVSSSGLGFVSALIALSIPACLSRRMQTFGLSCTTAFFNYLKNHNQLAVFSLSTKANASGTTWLFPSWPMAVKIWPLYLPVRNVPSTHITDRQWLKASMHTPKDQNTRCSTFTVGNSGIKKCWMST